MKYIIIALLVSLMGCGGSSGGNTPLDVPTFVGDSLCALDGSPADQLGWTRICKGGWKMEDVDSLPDGRVFLGIGTNDASGDIDLFELRLLNLLDSATGHVTCVLPTTAIWPTDPQREVLIEHCPDYIDPFDYGVVGALDGIHWDETENAIMAEVLRDYGL